jgi:glutamate synthase domain-containing protein 2/nitrite reductase/ring-hydroxylating ferredoxin subunit
MRDASPSEGSTMAHWSLVATWSSIPERVPFGVKVEGVDLVVVRRGEEHSVLYGRCLHRGALLADGTVRGDDLICGLHGWDYRIDSGVSAYNNAEVLERFPSKLDGDDLFVDRDAVIRWLLLHPQPYDPDVYQGLYQDPHMVPEEPFVKVIHELAQFGLDRTGHHGPVAAMGVPRDSLPSWDHIQFVTAQLARLPHLDDVPVSTEVCIGPNAAKPVWLDIPIFVSDMSFGALSEEAKVALARGAQLAGTAICSGEGGMLPEEQVENSRYFYELASARFGWTFDVLSKVQAFHFKGGQGAKTGTGGHLPGDKVRGKIAAVRGLAPGTPAISPARFPDWTSLDDYRNFAAEVRDRSGGIPIGFKLSAQHIEADLDAALTIGVDYVILDGRGGGTGAAPLLFRDHISVPTMPALARARRHLDRRGRRDVTLVVTGGLRTAPDYAKALALGADAVAIANSAIQAIGCVGMRACHSNNCPVGIATQKEHLRARLPVEQAAQRLARFLHASVELMSVLARACGHTRLDEFCLDDLTTFDRDIAALCGVNYAGVGAR